MNWKPSTGSAWPGFNPMLPGASVMPAVPSCPCCSEDAETLMTRVKRRNWADILDDLKRAGFARRKLALKLGVSTFVIGYWRAGNSEPRDTEARKLVILHRRFCTGNGHG
jgi:hypothetical protein